MSDEQNKANLNNSRKQIRREPTDLDVKKNDKVTEDTAKPKSEMEKAFEPKTLMSWQAPEFIYHEKNRNWYIIVVLIFAALIAFAVYSKSFLMAITFVVAGGIFYLYAQKKPITMDIAIREDGIQYHDQFFPYEVLNGFWITYEPPEVKSLTISTSQLFIPKITIILTDQDPVEIRKILIEEIPEDKDLEENTIDALTRRIKF